MLEILKAVIYGIIEGITEWLPISSTGHLILAEQVLKFQLSEEFMLMFEYVIQFAAIWAVIILFWGKLWPFKFTAPVDPVAEEDTGNPVVRWLRDHVRWNIMGLWLKILVATIPGAVAQLTIGDWIDDHMTSYVVVAMMLILYGIGFILVEHTPRRVRTTKLSRLTFKDAFVLGLFQVLALIPGTSRSGAIILGGILWGLSRPLAAQFAFFMAVPAMAGSSLLKVLKFVMAGNNLTGVEVVVLLIGCIVAFLVSMVAIRFLMNYVKTHSFTLFGYYRIALGIIVLVVFIVSTINGATAPTA